VLSFPFTGPKHRGALFAGLIPGLTTETRCVLLKGVLPDVGLKRLRSADIGGRVVSSRCNGRAVLGTCCAMLVRESW